MGSSTKLHFPRSSVVNPTNVTITVLKIDNADVKKIVNPPCGPLSNVLQVCVSPKNTVFQKPATVFLELPNSLIDKSYDKKMLRLLKSSHESEDWRDITTKVELTFMTENVCFQVDSFSKFWLVWKHFKIDDLQKIFRRTIKYQVQFLAMQQKSRPSFVSAQCVRSDLVEKRIKNLRENKYYGNDPCTKEHEFVEGQRFKVEVTGDIKVKPIRKEALEGEFHSQLDPNKNAFCKFLIEPRNAASKTSLGYIFFYTVAKTVSHAHESNEKYDNGNVCVEKDLSENWEYVDNLPIELESPGELFKAAKPVSETEIFEKLRSELASKIGKEWREIARRLGMEQSDLDRFENDNRDNMKEQISAMLCELFRKKAKDSKWLAELVEALNGAGRTDLAEMCIKEKKRLETQ